MPIAMMEAVYQLIINLINQINIKGGIYVTMSFRIY